MRCGARAVEARLVAGVVVHQGFGHGRGQVVSRAGIQAERRGLQHSGGEVQHSVRQVVVGVSLKVWGAAQIIVDGGDAMAVDRQLPIPFEIHQSVWAWVGHSRTRLNIIDDIATEGAHDDVLGVEVAREDRLHTVAGEQGRDRLVIIQHILRE